MNTKNKQDQKKNQRRQTRQEKGLKKRGENSNMLSGYRKPQDHEFPELRMTR
jgi:hypothetical protein